MASHVREYVGTCPSCMMNKPQGGKRPGLLQPLPVPEHAWACMGLDWITHMPITPEGYDAILVCVCTLTKMARLIPCKTSMTAAEAAEAVYKHVWSLFGTPQGW